MISWAHSSPQPKRHLDRFSRFCTDNCRVSLYFTMGRPFPSQSWPSIGGSGPPSNTVHGSLGPTESSTQTASRSVQPFLQGSLVWQTDRQTDHATRLVTIDLTYVLRCGLDYRQYYRKLIRRWDSERQPFTTTSSTTFTHTQCAPEATEFSEIMQNEGHFDRSKIAIYLATPRALLHFNLPDGIVPYIIIVSDISIKTRRRYRNLH